jgi:hypothetical protein
MLIVKIFIDEAQIDEICIQRKERIFNAHRADTYRYELVRPAGLYKKMIRHSRGYGWLPLLKKVLNVFPGAYSRKPYMGSTKREKETVRGNLRTRRPRLPGVNRLPSGWTGADKALAQIMRQR